jgi:hypothetical protein
VPRDPSQTVLYRVVADPLETFLAAVSLARRPSQRGFLEDPDLPCISPKGALLSLRIGHENSE